MTVKMQSSGDALAMGLETLDIEIEALQKMRSRMGASFNAAVEIILAMQGRLVIVGMGKSGIIGQKIAATLASTGTPSFFVHPGEEFHGDLGMIKPADVLLLISNSGETENVLRILPFLQHQKNRIISLTGKLDSTLASHSHVVLTIGLEREACKNNLAPTSSTTNALVMGDALAVALTVERDFQPEDFARFHPGSSLGRKLLTRVSDVMQKGSLPVCTPNAYFRDDVNAIAYGRLGWTLVMAQQEIGGIITDDNFRRAVEMQDGKKSLSVVDMMSSNLLKNAQNIRFSEAKACMVEKKVSALAVKVAEPAVMDLLQICGLKPEMALV